MLRIILCILVFFCAGTQWGGTWGDSKDNEPLRATCRNEMGFNSYNENRSSDCNAKPECRWIKGKLYGGWCVKRYCTSIKDTSVCNEMENVGCELIPGKEIFSEQCASKKCSSLNEESCSQAWHCSWRMVGGLGQCQKEY